MKFTALDGTVKEVEVPEGDSFSIVTTTIEGCKSHIVPRINANSGLPEIILHVMKIVSLQPFYLKVKDIPWILGVLDHFHELVLENRNEHHTRFREDIEHFATIDCDRRSYRSAEENPHRPNFVDLSRRFFCLELLAAHLYGCTIHSTKVVNDDLDEDSDEEVLVGALYGDCGGFCRQASHPEFPIDSMEFLYDRQFKTRMSQNFFKRKEAVLMVPEGSSIKFDLGGKDFVFDSGSIVKFSVDRFYTTEGGWYDGGGPCGYPESSQNGVDCSLGLMPLIKSKIVFDVLRGDSIDLYVPLDWITHFIDQRDSIMDLEYSIKRIPTHCHPDAVDETYETEVHDYVRKIKTEQAARTKEMFSRAGLRF